MAYRLGIDLGGTKILGVVFAADGRVLGSDKQRTRADDGYPAVLRRLVEVARNAVDAAGLSWGRHIDALGMGVPGPVSADARELLGATNLGWGPTALAADFEALCPEVRVVLGNDVNMGALGEARQGCATDVASAFALFVGTGLGGALIRDGAVVAGTRGMAGEIGHVPAPFGQRQCGCGQLGCLETVASKVGLEQLVREFTAAEVACLLDPGGGGPLKSKAIRRAYDDGCEATRKAIKLMARALAWAVVNVTAVADPECFILGGGLGERFGDVLIRRMRKYLERYPFFAPPSAFDIRTAALGDHAVAAGAAWTAAAGPGRS
ncbi:MAG: ROK family protein [Planctomycetota bacterium]